MNGVGSFGTSQTCHALRIQVTGVGHPGDLIFFSGKFRWSNKMGARDDEFRP